MAAATLAGAAVAAAFDSPEKIPPNVAVVWSDVSLVLVFGASIVLEAAPFVMIGTVVAFALRRLTSNRIAAPLIALVAPGCDCSLNGMAWALSGVRPPIAGFVLTWSAACGPAALFATHAALGDRLVFARMAGGAAAACATAVLWLLVGSPHTAREPHCVDADALVRHLAAAIGGVSFAALGAACFVTLAPHALSPSVFLAGLAGALLAPCSTADAVIARAMFETHAGQAAFVIAGQCVALRQLAMLCRHYGVTRALLAGAAGCIGCAVAVAAQR